MNNSTSKNMFRTLKKTFLARGFIKKFKINCKRNFYFNKHANQKSTLMQNKNTDY